MKRTQWLQETRIMRFEQAFYGWTERRLTQSEAAQLLGVHERTFRRYINRYQGWNVKHFYSFYQRRHGGSRSYTWVKNTLQRAGLVKKAPGRGKHRKRRERSPMIGMMLHQDGSTRQWIPGQYGDLIVTMDDATNEHCSIKSGNDAYFSGPVAEKGGEENRASVKT